MPIYCSDMSAVQTPALSGGQAPGSQGLEIGWPIYWPVEVATAMTATLAENRR